MIETDRIKIIDLFAGCGGLMDGFEQSNLYQTIAAVEWEKAPCINLIQRLKDKWNYKDADKKVLRFDIQRTDELFKGWKDDNLYGSSEGLDRLVQEANGIDIIIGGPPCQAYSIAGRIRDEHGMRLDYRNFLFESYLRVVKKYKPLLFVFENVPGLLSAKPYGKPIVNTIYDEFNKAGYTILKNLNNAVIDFTEYGVPQRRNRMVIIGVSKEHFGKEKSLEMVNAFYDEILPKNKVKKKKTVRDAIGDLPALYPLENEIQFERKKYLIHCLNHLLIIIYPDGIARGIWKYLDC